MKVVGNLMSNMDQKGRIYEDSGTIITECMVLECSMVFFYGIG